MPQPPAHPPHAPRSYYPPLILLLILALFVYLLSIFYVPAFYGGADESAYLLTAKQLATTHSPIVHNPDPTVFLSQNMLESAPGVFVAKYPVGYPLLCALAYAAAGPAGPFWVNPLAGALLILGTYLLVRAAASPPMGLLAAFTLALHPLIVFYSVGALSHVADAACVAWGFYFALLWLRSAGSARSTLAAAATGFLLAYAVAIRYSEALLILPLLVLIAQRLSTLRHQAAQTARLNPPPSNTRRAVVPSWFSPALLRDLAAMALGALLALLPLFWYQTVCYGSPFATGYGLTRESSSFSLESLRAHFAYALLSLNRPGFGLALIFPLALAYILYAAARDRWRALFLAAWIFPTLLLYMAYYWSTTGQPTLYIRFFLPIFPALLIAALLLIQQLTRSHKLWQRIALGCLAAVPVWGFVLAGARYDVEQALATARFSDDAARLAATSAPPGSILLCDQWTAYFLVYAGDYTIYYPRYFDAAWVQARLADQTQTGVHQFNPLRAQRFAAALGNRTQPQLDALLIATLQQHLAAHRPVFILTTTARAPQWQARFRNQLTLTPTATTPYTQTMLAVTPAPATQPVSTQP